MVWRYDGSRRREGGWLVTGVWGAGVLRYDAFCSLNPPVSFL